MADDRMRELEERYEGYTVYDRDGDKIGKVDDLFVDETDREEYIGVRMGLFGLSGTTLIPMEIARLNQQERAIEVAESKEHVKDAPTYSDDDDVTGEFEDRIRSHFGLESLGSSAERGSYGRSSGAAADATSAGDDTLRGDRTDDAARHSERPAGGAQDKDVYDEREREPLGQEEYRNREDMGSESAMGAASAGGEMPSGGQRDLETGEPGRAEREGADAGNMTRGHREGGDLGEGDQGGAIDEGYREGYREGLREGLREGGGRGDVGDRDEPGERRDPGSSGAMTGSGSTEEGMTRGGGAREEETGETRGGEPGRGGDPESRERSADRSQERPQEGAGSQEEGEITRVWRRIRG